MTAIYKVAALFGPSGSGKDTIINETVRASPENFRKIIRTTTRPRREGESLDSYFFIENYEWVDSDYFIKSTFNDWNYGIRYKDLDEHKVNLGVFSPNELALLKNDPHIQCVSILLYVSDKNRLIRCLNREKEPNCDEIIRRYLTDKEDFKDFSCDLSFNNNTLNDRNFVVNYLRAIIPSRLEQGERYNV